ncbi:hypothetical protein [Sphingomonas sp.]|uniref:hypothetical protein n=1 Tax=Sphingomonas sp. TaxID=28214 RepID=UPI003B0084D1
MSIQDLSHGLIDAALRRLALLQDGETPLQDILDLADLALAAGDGEGALLLFGAAALEQGPSSRRVPGWQDTANRTGLWRAPPPLTAGLAQEPILDRAISGLRTLLSEWPSLTIDDRPVEDAASPRARGQMPLEKIVATSVAIVGPVRELLEGGRESAATVLRRVLDACDGWTLPRPSSHAAVDGAILARLVTLRRLHRLAIAFEEVEQADASLATRVMTLDASGMGSLFANLPRLVTAPHDLPALLRLATKTPLAPEEEAAWLSAITVQAPRAWSTDLAALAARRAGPGLLRLLARRGVRRGEPEWLWVSRDAALAIGDGDVAVEVQRALIRVSPYSWSEWHILGDMLGLMGKVEAADQAFETCMSLKPTSELPRRRAALASGNFEVVARSSGFFAEPGRTHLRPRSRSTSVRDGLPRDQAVRS